MAVITISRQFGAGGRTVGEMISERLGYKFLDDLIIHELAKAADVSTDFIKSIERDAGSKISKFIAGLLSTNYYGAHGGR